MSNTTDLIQRLREDADGLADCGVILGEKPIRMTIPKDMRLAADLLEAKRSENWQSLISLALLLISVCLLFTIAGMS